MTVVQGAPFREGMWAVSPYNFDESVNAGMQLPRKVQLLDLTLREGRQVDGVSLTPDDVIEFARRIDAVGIPMVEMHHDDPEEIRQVKQLGLKLKVQALVPSNYLLDSQLCRGQVDRFVDVGADIVCIALAVSDYNFGLAQAMSKTPTTRANVLDQACEAVQYAKGRGVTVNALVADFTRMKLEWLKTVTGRLAQAGADIVRLDEICAPCRPAVCRHHAQQVKQAIGGIPLAIHTHNDFDLGLASQLGALEGGAEILEGSVNGLGERAGVPNIAVLASALKLLYGYDMGLRLDAFQELAEFVADVWRKPIPAHMAGTGRNAFSQCSEVHYVVPESEVWAFNAWAPEVIGNRTFVPLCHYSGPMAVKRKARDLGLGELGVDAANRVLAQVRSELRHRKTPLSDRRFAQLVARATKR